MEYQNSGLSGTLIHSLQTVPPNTEVLLHGNDYTGKADPGSAFGIQKQNWGNHALILKGFNNDDISFNTLKFNCI